MGMDRLDRSLANCSKPRTADRPAEPEKIDTSSAAGELIFHVFGAIAHFERRLISERMKDGIAAAQAKGKLPGFKEKTGKPYLVQILANETAAYARVLYTLLQQQNADFFADPTKITLNTPEAKSVVELMKKIRDEGLTTTGLDYAASVTSFTSGDGGIAINGTWLIGDFVAQAEKQGTALSGGYSVYPVPQIYPGRDSTYADGQSWGLPHKNRKPEQTGAIGKLLKFLAGNDFQWARTGHLPAVKTVFDMPEFKSLPRRENIAKVGRQAARRMVARG